MKINIFLFLSILTLLTSCNGQTTTQKVKTDNIVKGDVVTELDGRIMIVYQDTNDVYWFGSWDSGVYKYDGETLINYTTKHGLPNNRIDEIKEDKAGNLYFTSCHPNSTISKYTIRYIE